MSAILAFLVGSVVGTCSGFIVLSLAITSKQADKHLDKIKEVRNNANNSIR